MKILLKKYLFIITLLIMCAVHSMFAYAAEKDSTTTKGGNLLKYTENDTVVTVSSAIKVINKYTFPKNNSIKEIIISEGVTAIAYGSFFECSSLKKVTIPKSVTDWDLSSDEYFYNESSLEEYWVDPANPQFSSIDGVVYNKAKTALLYYPPNKKDEVYTIPDSVINISKVDFSRARYLKHIIFNTKGSMNYQAYLYGNGFVNGTLERFTVPEQNEFFCDIDGVLFTKNKKILIAYPENKRGKVYRIPEGTELIDTHAFNTRSDDNDDCELKYILFPSSIKTIEFGTASIIDSDDSTPNQNLTFLGKKGSLVETYAKLHKTPFYSYDSLKNELLLTPEDTATLDPLLVSTSSDQLITWKSSNSSIATVDQKGNISAKKLGTTIISASSKNGSKATCKVTVTLPAPKDLKIDSSSSSGRVFTWSKVPGATSYTIYYTTVCANYYAAMNGDLCLLREPITKLGTTADTTFTDQMLTKDTEYYYLITADHADSQYSSGYSIPFYVVMPKIPKKVTLTPNNHGINISWTPDLFPYGLIIYRATSKCGKYEIIKETQDVSLDFVDTNVKSGATYFYKIQVYNISGGATIYSDYTEPVSIKFKTTSPTSYSSGKTNAAARTTYSDIDQYLERSVKSAAIPGMSVIIVDNNNVLFSNTYGNCSDIDTPFIIGSMSKSFTAVSMMQLVEQGKINLDAKISSYLPEITFGDKITVRQLLNQTSGLGQYQRLSDAKLTSSYGTFQYANVNYILLGKIIERVSKMSYEEYVTEHIFNQLKMTHSAASLGKSQENGLISGYRNFFGFPIAGPPDYPVENSWGQVSSGYISSSASDMGKYLQMYLNGGGQILTPESVDTVFYSNVLVDPKEPYSYGMGWSLSGKYKEPLLEHSGLVENYMSDMMILPESGIGVVLLTNTNDYLVADEMFDTIRESMVLMLTGEAPIEINSANYLLSHLLYDLLYFVLLLGTLLPLFLLKHYKRKLNTKKLSRVIIMLIIMHVLFPTALLILPRILISPLWVIRLFVPDLFLTLVAGAVALYVGGVIKAVLIYRTKSREMLSSSSQ